LDKIILKNIHKNIIDGIKNYYCTRKTDQQSKVDLTLFYRPGRADVVLSVPALISRTAGYAIRMSGVVGGALSDGRPYPYMCGL